MEGIGSSITVAAYSTIIIKLYPKKIGTVTSWSLTTVGVGYSLGPVIGGFLYDIRGFHLPFVTIGVTNLFFAIVSLMALLSIDCIKAGSSEKSGVVSTVQLILKVIYHI